MANIRSILRTILLGASSQQSNPIAPNPLPFGRLKRLNRMVLFFAAFIFLLLANLAVHVESVTFLSIRNADTSAHIELGIYGACNYASEDSVQQSCSHTLGYTLDPSTYLLSAAACGETQLPSVVPKKLEIALVMNTISLALLAFGLALAAGLVWTTKEDLIHVLWLALPIHISRLVLWASFWVDVAFALVVRNRVHDRLAGSGWSGHIGNALWLTFAALIAMECATADPRLLRA